MTQRPPIKTEAPPLFTREGPPLYQQAFQHNQAYATPGPYQTQLAPAQEAAFRQWLARYQVPFDPNAHTVDYDMRGYWKASGGQPHTAGAHFPDTYKTPYDTTFSGESRYAKPGTPFDWQGQRLVDERSGQVVFSPPALAAPDLAKITAPTLASLLMARTAPR